MFRKKEDIEQDFIAYGNTFDKHQSPADNPLGKIIQLLSILVLLGIVTLMGMFGYKYWQSEFASNQPAAVSASATAPSVQSANTNHIMTTKPSEKLYTQEEMQAIVAMLLQQMQSQQHKIQNPKQPSETSELASSVKTEPKPQDHHEDETDTLIAALNDIQIQPLNLPLSIPEQNNTNRYAVTAAQQEQTTQQDNKVLFSPTKNSYDDVANLSKEIGNIVESMQKKSTSAYTRAIKQEISEREQEMRFIVVQKGDTLSKIAQRAYGNAMAFDIILEANPDLIENPDHIYVGQRLRVPLVKE